MLIGCINCYNDIPLIRDCIESIYNKVDKIIAIDGSYADFPDGSGYSTDGTVEYLNRLDKVELMTTYGLSEVQKRNLYLESLSDGDIVLNLDADEVLVGEIPELKTDFAILDLVDGHSKHVQRRATRLFKYKSGMKYQFCHYTLYDNNGIMINKLHEVVNKNFTFELIKSCHILHNWNSRSDKRKYDKQIYYKKLIKIESKYPK